MTVFHFLYFSFEWNFLQKKEKSEQRKPATNYTTDKYKLIHYVHITTTLYSIFKGVIWCDIKFSFLLGVLQADCA